MAKQIEEESNMSLNQPLKSMRFRESSHIAKTRKHRSKMLEAQSEENSSSFRPIEEPEASQERAVVHSTRHSAVEFPDIRRSSEMAAVPSRPKKSIKSKLIQDALKLRDKSKIRHIRKYLKHEAAPAMGGEEEGAEEFEIDSRSFSAFEQHQQKVLSIIRRFRRGL
jgi:hypothetical protein